MIKKLWREQTIIKKELIAKVSGSIQTCHSDNNYDKEADKRTNHYKERINCQGYWNHSNMCDHIKLHTFKQISLKLCVTTNMIPYSSDKSVIAKLLIAQSTTPMFRLRGWTGRNREVSVL